MLYGLIHKCYKIANTVVKTYNNVVICGRFKIVHQLSITIIAWLIFLVGEGSYAIMPYDIMHKTLLNACTVYGNIDIGEML